MPWKSSYDIDYILANEIDAEKVESAYTLHQFALNAIFPASYKTSPKWAEMIVLSEAGRAYVDSCAHQLVGFASEDIHFAVFGTFAHHDLLIDLDESDIGGIKRLINQELLENMIRLPYRWGRLLYDKYNDQSQHNGNRVVA